MTRFHDFCYNAVIVAPEIARDPLYGTETKKWTREVCKIRCGIRSVSGREFFSDASRISENVFIFSTWQNGRIETNMGVRFHGEIYEIAYIDRKNLRGPYMEIRADLLKGEGLYGQDGRGVGQSCQADETG